MKKYILGLLTSFFVMGSTFGSSTFSYLYGDGYVTGDKQRNIIRFTGSESYGIVDLFGRVDIGSFDGKSSLNTRLLGRLNVANGWGVSTQLQNANEVNVGVIGIGYTHKEKDNYWLIDVGRSSSNCYDSGTHFFGYLNKRLYNSFYLEGFAEFSALDKGVNILLTQPSIMYRFKHVGVGIEQQIYRNKFGVEGLDESVSQFKVQLFF